ncbi:PH domain-containing protein [Nesterenkonia sp. NBAIMH1]|uniref:PH domain-containing protein n=1 Tax=Nesterenkonia sp. NBAIMH1 TaxID=2600320 RepID=UPI0011B5D1E5|nr:PH domain-containing protein [Nesterenkonia sp. NBAIMH1]
MLLKLVDDEQVVVRARAHFRALIPPLVSMLATIAVMMFLIGYLGRPSQPAFVQHYSHIGIFIVWAVGGLLLLFGAIKPVLSWLNRFTYLTTHRVVQKNIVGGANAVVVPLGLVTGADWRQSKAQEMFDAGDIVLTHGAYDQYQRTKLKDMPDAARLHGLVAQQLQDYRRQAARQHMGAQPQFGGYGGPPPGRPQPGQLSPAQMRAHPYAAGHGY